MKRQYLPAKMLGAGILCTLVSCVGNHVDEDSNMADRFLPREELGFCEHTDVLAVRVRGKAPVYPVKRYLEHEEGSTKLTFTIDATGKPVNFVNVMSTHTAFYANTKIALEEWQIEPALENNVPVPVNCTFEMNFFLKGKIPG